MTPDDAELLVVDDEPFLREAVAASLRFLGFAVTAAENGTDALRLARGRSFDLMVLDVLLPDIDGFEIVRRLRRDGNRVPVIFLTAKDTQDDKITGLTIGGDDYMTKHARKIRWTPMMRRPKALLRRLLRTQLRLKAMAGVVVITLVALVAFDVAAVATMRRYLLTQTDSNLRVALTLTVPRLATLLVVLGSIAVVLLIGLGVILVLRRGLRPIESMAAQAERVTAGDLTGRVTPHSPRSEVGRLGSALNGMLARIETGVQEREASQQQMRRFFADASHELRTPLASLRANAELYQQGALSSPDEVDEVMHRIALETRRMGRLVDDMLRLARLGQHPGQSREPVDVSALVRACAERVLVADPARTWRVSVADGLVTTGDEELLRRAVDNLLTNVLVHTAADTAATITASGDPARQDEPRQDEPRQVVAPNAAKWPVHPALGG